MADDNNLLGKTLGQVGSLTKQIGKGVAEEVKKTVKTTTSQIGGIEQNKEDKSSPVEAGGKAQVDKTIDQANKDIIKEMYAPSTPPVKKEEPKNPTQQMAQSISEKNPDKSAEEIQKMVSLQQQLHNQTYYDPLVNPPQKQRQQEERPAEKVEREKEEERWKLQEKEKEKPPPLAVQREKNKTEQFRGASG